MIVLGLDPALAVAAVRFTVPGNPIPWQRARSRGAQRFTPPRVRQAEEAIRAGARNAGLRRPWPGPLHLSVTFCRQDGRPADIDNLVKLVLDALNDIAFQDDRQVVALTVVKCVDAARPRTEIVLVQVVAARSDSPVIGMARTLATRKAVP